MSYGRGDLTAGGGTGAGSFGSDHINSYQNDGAGGRSTQADYTRLTQLISSNIQKIQQNGECIECY